MTDKAISPLRQRMIEDMTIRKLAPRSPRRKIAREHFCFAGCRPAIIRLALTPSWIPIASFDLRSATPVLTIAIRRPGSSPSRSIPKQAFQQTAAAEIPIASDARSLHTSRGFLPWRFADAGPGVRRTTFMGPASANLHRLGHSGATVQAGGSDVRSWSMPIQPKGGNNY
jgi:hypothetical protein